MTPEEIARKLGLALSKAGTVVNAALSLAATEIFHPSPYPDKFAASTDPKSIKLQNALNTAINGVATAHGQTMKDPRDPKDPAQASVFPIPMTIVDLNTGPPFPVGHYNATEVDFVASEDKIAALFAAWELRAMVRRFAVAFGISNPATLFPELKTRINPFIRAQVDLVRDSKDVNLAKVNIPDKLKVPVYETLFRVESDGAGGLKINFTQGDTTLDGGENYAKSLRDMIVDSDDPAASRCIRGIGYGFLNGALTAGGFYRRADNTKPKTGNGMWLAGDYDQAAFIRGIVSANDGDARIAGTTGDLAKLMTLIHIGTFADPGDPDGDLLKSLLHGASTTGAFPPLLKSSLTQGQYVLNKLGWGELGRGEKGAHKVASETAVIKDLSNAGRSYVVACQNLEMTSGAAQVNDKNGNAMYQQPDVAAIVERAVTIYET